MDKKLQIVQQLYEDGPKSAEELIREEPGLAAEAHAMGEVKSLVDRREHARPDVGVIDAIVARAASDWQHSHSETSQQETSHDVDIRPLRAPVRHARVYAIRMAVAACAVFMVVAAGLWRLGMDDTEDLTATDSLVGAQSSPQVESEETRAIIAQGNSFDRDDVADVSGAREGVFAQSKVLAKSEDDLIPSWTDSGDLEMMRLRMQSLRRASSSLGWDGTSAPLEMLPAGQGAPGFQQASATRNGNN